MAAVFVLVGELKPVALGEPLSVPTGVSLRVALSEGVGALLTVGDEEAAERVAVGLSAAVAVPLPLPVGDRDRVWVALELELAEGVKEPDCVGVPLPVLVPLRVPVDECVALPESALRVLLGLSVVVALLEPERVATRLSEALPERDGVAVCERVMEILPVALVLFVAVRVSEEDGVGDDDAAERVDVGVSAALELAEGLREPLTEALRVRVARAVADTAAVTLELPVPRGDALPVREAMLEAEGEPLTDTLPVEVSDAVGEAEAALRVDVGDSAEVALARLESDPSGLTLLESDPRPLAVIEAVEVELPVRLTVPVPVLLTVVVGLPEPLTLGERVPVPLTVGELEAALRVAVGVSPIDAVPLGLRLEEKLAAPLRLGDTVAE